MTVISSCFTRVSPSDLIHLCFILEGDASRSFLVLLIVLSRARRGDEFMLVEFWPAGSLFNYSLYFPSCLLVVWGWLFFGRIRHSFRVSLDIALRL